MKKYLLPIVLLSISVFLFSCLPENDATEPGTNGSTEETTDAKTEAEELGFRPIACHSIGGKPHCIYNANDDGEGDPLFTTLGKFMYKGSGEAKELFSMENEYTQFSGKLDPVDIKGTKYLYFDAESSSTGNAVSWNTIHFCLINPRDGAFTKLDYEGEPEYLKTGDVRHVKGDFASLEGAQTELVDFLKGKAKTHPHFYNPSEADLDPLSAQNYAEKWNTDNPDIPQHFGTEKPGNKRSLKLHPYKEDLFAIQVGSESSKVSNDAYEAISYFRGDVILKNKATNEFYALWVDSCNHGCDKSLSWDNEHTLVITYEEMEGKSATINLKDFSYTVSGGE